MLNPGSSSLADTREWTNFINKEANITGEIVLDDTMQANVDILESAIPQLNGVLHIHNLFDLRNSASDKALDLYKKLQDKNIETLEHDFKLDFISKFPWVWIAWGVEDQKEINARKRKIKNVVRSSGKPIFGIYTQQKKFLNSSPRIHYYHPLPQNPNQKQTYKDGMVAQFKSFLETGCTSFLE